MAHLKIVVVYRQRLLRQALRAVLAEQPDVVEVLEAGDAREAMVHATRARPDVVVMDAHLPEGGAVEAVARMREHAPDTRVILLTSVVDDEAVLEALRAGASGCVLKDAPIADLVKAVRVASRGGSYLSPALETQMLESLHPEPYRGNHSDRNGMARSRRQQLSPREGEVLRLVAEDLGNQQIARRLVLSVKTVEAHKANIVRKLNVRGRTALIKYAIRRGLIDLEADVRSPEPAAAELRSS